MRSISPALGKCGIILLALFRAISVCSAKPDKSVSEATQVDKAPDFAPLSANGLKQLDRLWARFQSHDRDLSSRELYQFFLSAVVHHWRPESLGSVLDLVEAMHDRDPSSATYGNYRWYWHETKPDDRNAVEFCMQLAGLTWTLYRDRLPADARAKLAAALALGVEGMLRHKVDVSYTNIFLMRLSNCILIGEQTDRPDVLREGVAWLDEWFVYTRKNGVHEYSSPTYYAVDLEDLGALARYSVEEPVRTKACQALRFFWTDIGANWFAPHQALGGAHSRDYDFLLGHGELDRHLAREGWIQPVDPNELQPILPEITHWAPPADLLGETPPVPRIVSQSWGPQTFERAVNYVGRNFSLGSAGASYNAQDKVLNLALSGGPKRPLITFSFDYRNDPYGLAKIETSGSHPKLTHLVPFVASVQREAEVLLLAAIDPARTPNPAGKNRPMIYASVNANLVLPADVQLWTDDDKPLVVTPGAHLPLRLGQPVYLRDGDTAVALCFLAARNDEGHDAEFELMADGAKQHAERLVAKLAQGTPRSLISAAVWVRAAEGLNDAGFALFRAECARAASAAVIEKNVRNFVVSIPGRSGLLTLRADLQAQKRLEIAGADEATSQGILSINGRDFGTELLR